MNKERALYLLDGGFDEGERDVALVHGTSTATVMEFMRKGVLPAATNTKYKGHIYFYPIAEHFTEHLLRGRMSGITLQTAENRAALESETNERSTYLNKLISADLFVKRDSPSGGDLAHILDIVTPNQTELERVFRLYKREDLIPRKREIQIELNNCKGVLLGINKAVLSFVEDKDIEIDEETDYVSARGHGAGVRIYLPQGLDEKYLQYIYALGEKEDKIIREFVERELI